MKTTKCMYCSKTIQVKGGRLANHVTPGNQKCLGVGLLAEQNDRQMKLLADTGASRKGTQP